ncbi:6-phosphofructo-2-kinase/fructose-2,6-bisphosphatase-like [Rhodnius prolixus]|uniref:6-phosphofructo-2-kinase/fructose-2, 6-bisphosphatase-like n=1 Tax=Rhodnius prolixus TaxID=13249 RepID=UPI003D18931F
MAPTSLGMTSKEEPKERCMKSSQAHGHFVPLIVAFVGLPARGKTVLAHKLERYLNYTGHLARVFSLSTYRRKLAPDIGCDFIFDPQNEEATEIRKQYTHEAINDCKQWIYIGGDIAILDGTYAAMDVRQLLYSLFVKQLGFKILFIECIVEDEILLEGNINDTVRLSEDYAHLEYNQAVKEIQKKIKQFSSTYVPISKNTESIFSYIKFYNAGENIFVHRIDGPFQTKVLNFVSCFRPMRKKTLYFTRHGESEFNLLGRIGGDTDLSPRGHFYATLLAKYFNSNKIENLRVWTSEKKRTKQTANGIKAPVESLAPLNELDAGICEGMTYEEIQMKFPQEFAWRDQDKLRYRYPWGESYIDIMSRLELVLLELEREDSLLVISHQAVLRCVLGYFLNTESDKVPYLGVPLHTVIKLTINGYDWNVDYIKFNVDCVDTYRSQPENCSVDRSNEDVLVTIPKHFDSNPWRKEPTLINI